MGLGKKVEKIEKSQSFLFLFIRKPYSAEHVDYQALNVDGQTQGCHEKWPTENLPVDCWLNS